LIQENNLKQLHTMVNLGSHFYAQAKIPDTTYIYVNIGLGFHVQFTLTEALQFIDKKEESLNNCAQKLTEQATQIKARIQLICGGINELMKLNH